MEFRRVLFRSADKFAQEAFADKNMPRVGQWYGHWLKAFVQLYYKRDYERALEEAETTVRYAPNHSETLADSALIATYAGAEDQAIEWVTRAISRDPTAPDWSSEIGRGAGRERV